MKTPRAILAKYHKNKKWPMIAPLIWTNADMIQGFLAGIGVGITLGLLIAFTILY